MSNYTNCFKLEITVFSNQLLTTSYKNISKPQIIEINNNYMFILFISGYTN